MGSYDRPGYPTPIPGNPGFQSHDSAMTAPGSAVAQPDTDSFTAGLQAGTVGNSAVVTPVGGSLVNADRVEVGPLDTLGGSQAQSYGANRDPLTGIGAALGQTGAGMGTGHNPHPNSTARP